MILAMTLRNSDEPIAFESPSKPFAASALGASAWRRSRPKKPILAMKANAHARANDASFAPLLARTRAER